jgi:hypothetical protein
LLLRLLTDLRLEEGRVLRLLADLRLEEGRVVLEPATIWPVPQPHLLVVEAFPVLQVDPLYELDDPRLIVAYELLAQVFVPAGRLLFEEYLRRMVLGE